MVIMDLFDPGSQYRDRYAILNALREEGDGIHPGPFPDSWFLTRYDDISRIQRDAAAFLTIDLDFAGHFASLLGVSRDDPRVAVARAWESSMLFKDPPEHRRLRMLVSAAFTPSAIAAMRSITEKIAGQLLDTVDPGAETNLVDAFSVPLPVYVIATMLGFEADNSDLLAWSMAVADIGEQGMGFAGDAERTMDLGAELIQHVEQISEQRRRIPRDDLISGLCAAEDQGDKLDHDELVGMVLLLLAAGNITTTHLIGNAVALLLDHPDQWQRLLDDENLVPSAVDEVLRFAPSIQMSARRCTADVVFGERQIPAGSTLLTITGAGNRDPRQFPNPDTFDIGRNDRTHLSFALGIHTCLGAGLARMEADVALRAMLHRFPHMTPGGTPRQQRSGLGVGGFDCLPVIFGGQR